MRTCAAAGAVGFAFGLFVTAFVDPVAIGWPLAPIIGAFLGAVVSGVLGGLLRLLLTGLASGGELPGWAVALAVLAVAVAAPAVLSAVVALDGQVGDRALALAVVGSSGLAALVVLVRHGRMAQVRARKAR